MSPLKLGLVSLIAITVLAGTPRAAGAASSGGVTITLTCVSLPAGSGTSMSATLKVTANESSSVVTVPCGGSVTVTNPSWRAGDIATFDHVSVPKGWYLSSAPDVILTTGVVAASPELGRCSTRVKIDGECSGEQDPVPGLVLLGAAYFGAIIVLLPLVLLLRRRMTANLRRNVSASPQQVLPESAEQILDRRLAQGQISAEEYQYEKYLLEKK